MKIGKLNVFINGDSQLIVEKNKFSKYAGLIFYTLLFLMSLGFIYFFISSGKKRYSKNLFAWIVIYLLVLAVIVIFYYNIKRTIRKSTNYCIALLHGKILVNDIFFCSYQELSPINILKFTDGDGASFYNVLLESSDKNCQLALDLSKEESLSFAGILSEYLGIDFVIKNKSMMVP